MKEIVTKGNLYCKFANLVKLVIQSNVMIKNLHSLVKYIPCKQSRHLQERNVFVWLVLLLGSIKCFFPCYQYWYFLLGLSVVLVPAPISL